jgi:hypothetical protein
MTPAVRKLNLTAHLITSIGWLGAVASFLALSIVGLTSRDAESVGGAYVAMNVIGAFVIVPLSVAAMFTGLLQSLGTEWGLFRRRRRAAPRRVRRYPSGRRRSTPRSVTAVMRPRADG